jgi:hypothetical protein
MLPKLSIRSNVCFSERTSRKIGLHFFRHCCSKGSWLRFTWIVFLLIPAAGRRNGCNVASGLKYLKAGAVWINQIPIAHRWVKPYPEFHLGVGQINSGIWSSPEQRVGQTFSGIPGSDHSRNGGSEGAGIFYSLFQRPVYGTYGFALILRQLMDLFCLVYRD